MDPEAAARLQQMEEKIDELNRRLKSIQNYHRIGLAVTIFFFILPFVISAFALPYLLQTLTTLSAQYQAL